MGLDVGSSRAWSTGAILWPSGRLAGLAVAPGLPGIEELEKRDGKRRGLYDELRADGILTVDEGRRVVRVRALIDRVLAFRPEVIVCDRFRLPAVLDAVAGRCRVIARVTRWSESTADIMATRRHALDGGLAVVPECRRIFRFTLAESTVEHDDSGNVRMVGPAGLHKKPYGGMDSPLVDRSETGGVVGSDSAHSTIMSRRRVRGLAASRW